MQVYKSSVVKELMHRIGECMAHAEHCTERIGTETQMCYLTQVFEAGPVLQLQRKFFSVTFAKNSDTFCLYFYFLSFPQRWYHDAIHAY